jgi:prepilin-type processing-associated H-X9-DG protein
MEITVRKNDLVRELQLVQGIVERKNSIPILANVKCEAKGSELRISATDLDVSLRCGCPAQVVKEGSITLGAKKLHEIARSLPDSDLRLKVLPEAWTEASDGVSGYGWAVALLPFLEEPELQRAIHCKLAVTAAQNDTPRNTDLTIMRCPSDISESTFELHPEHEETESSTEESSEEDTTSLARLPTANYMGVFGTLEADETFPAPAGDGAIVAHRAVHYADLERGQSHTLLVGERPTSMVPSTWFGVNFQGEDAACRLVGSAITTPNCDSCDECEFGSRHSGGSNFAWADGHVCLLPDNIDPLAYQLLAKRQML